MTPEQLKKWRQDLIKYYNNLYFWEGTSFLKKAEEAADTYIKKYLSEPPPEELTYAGQSLDAFEDMVVTPQGVRTNNTQVPSSEISSEERAQLQLPDEKRVLYNKYLDDRYTAMLNAGGKAWGSTGFGKDLENIPAGILGTTIAAPFLTEAAGNLAAQGINAYGAWAAAHPIASGAIDLGLTADGVRNLVSDNGISKTVRLAKEGKYGRAALSGTVDALDLLGGISLLNKGYRGVKGAKNLLNASKLELSEAPIVNVGLFSSKIRNGNRTLVPVRDLGIFPEGDFVPVRDFKSGSPFSNYESSIYQGNIWMANNPKVHEPYNRNWSTGRDTKSKQYRIPKDAKVKTIDGQGKGWADLYTGKLVRDAKDEGYQALKINNLYEGGDNGGFRTDDFIIFEGTPRKFVNPETSYTENPFNGQYSTTPSKTISFEEVLREGLTKSVVGYPGTSNGFTYSTAKDKLAPETEIWYRGTKPHDPNPGISSTYPNADFFADLDTALHFGSELHSFEISKKDLFHIDVNGNNWDLLGGRTYKEASPELIQAKVQARTNLDNYVTGLKNELGLTDNEVNRLIRSIEDTDEFDALQDAGIIDRLYNSNYSNFFEDYNRYAHAYLEATNNAKSIAITPGITIDGLGTFLTTDDIARELAKNTEFPYQGIALYNIHDAENFTGNLLILRKGAPRKLIELPRASNGLTLKKYGGIMNYLNYIK